MSLTAMPAVFLDRDGTLMEEAHYCSHPDQVKIIPGVPEALRALKDAGYRLVVITNQSGIGRGYYTLADYEAVSAHFLNLLGGGLIDATYFCLEAPEKNSPRRKPATGMLVEAQRDLGLDFARSWFIGDKAVDVQCGRAAGVRPILVLTGHGAKEDASGAEFVAKDFASAAAFILKTSDA
ncbi:D-glycero-alpha-D-manno-heptose-1,7-bisphosphate 7-phosphatase [Chthoniobacter flavus]|nr:HAD family hydrolase [Chthoniobacter flavus]